MIGEHSRELDPARGGVLLGFAICGVGDGTAVLDDLHHRLAHLRAVLAVLGYLVAHWDLTLTRTPTQWRLTRGLLTTRETSVEDARLAGVVAPVADGGQDGRPTPEGPDGDVRLRLDGQPGAVV